MGRRTRTKEGGKTTTLENKKGENEQSHKSNSENKWNQGGRNAQKRRNGEMDPAKKKQRMREELKQEQKQEDQEQHKPDELEHILEKLMGKEEEVEVEEYDKESMEDEAAKTIEIIDDRDKPRKTMEGNGDQNQQTYRQTRGKNKAPKLRGGRNRGNTSATENRYKRRTERQREEAQSATAITAERKL